MAGRAFHDGYFAHNANHLFGIAVAHTPTIEFTVFQRCFIAHATDLVHHEKILTLWHIHVWWKE